MIRTYVFCNSCILLFGLFLHLSDFEALDVSEQLASHHVNGVSILQMSEQQQQQQQQKGANSM